MNPLKSINPSFNSELVSELFNLEKIRYTHLRGTTPPWLFFDLREIMYILESVASARIEGNRTTVVSAAMDSLSNDEKTSDENLQELRNIRKAIDFIEETFDGLEIGENVQCTSLRAIINRQIILRYRNLFKSYVVTSLMITIIKWILSKLP